MLSYEKDVAALTPADVQAVAKRYLRQDNYVQVVLLPSGPVIKRNTTETN